MKLGGWLAVAAALVGCVSGDDTSDAATQGSLGGPCFANSTCNSGLVCTLVNGKGVCESSDATTDTTLDQASDQNTADVTNDASDAGVADAQSDACDAALTFAAPCDAGCNGQLCCPTGNACSGATESACETACGGQPCWQCSAKCSSLFCCAPNAAVQSTCPPKVTIAGTQCTATCPTGLYICTNNADCPTTNPTCVLASVTGLNNRVVGVCQ